PVRRELGNIQKKRALGGRRLVNELDGEIRDQISLEGVRRLRIGLAVAVELGVADFYEVVPGALVPRAAEKSIDIARDVRRLVPLFAGNHIEPADRAG